MDKGLLIIILACLLILPVAYFLGIKAYLGFLMVLGIGFVVYVLLAYFYWYIFKREG